MPRAFLAHPHRWLSGVARAATLASTLAACSGSSAPAAAPSAPVPPSPQPDAVSLMPSVLPPPPATARQDIADVLHGVRVEDPYRWLEPVDAPEVQRWVAEQSAYTRRVLDALPTQAALTERFTDILDLQLLAELVAEGGWSAVREACVEVFLLRKKHSWPPSVTIFEGWAEGYERTAIENGFPVTTIDAAVAAVESIIERIDRAI